MMTERKMVGDKAEMGWESSTGAPARSWARSFEKPRVQQGNQMLFRSSGMLLEERRWKKPPPKKIRRRSFLKKTREVCSRLLGLQEAKD